jgi:hypothetical protein
MRLVLMRVHGAAEAHDGVVRLRSPRRLLATMQAHIGDRRSETVENATEERRAAAVAVHERDDLHSANVYSR